MSAVIVNSGPEIKNRCTDIPEMCFIAAAIANSGTEIGNHSSAIVSASRMARLRKVIAATLLRPILISVASKKNGPPAEGHCRHAAASDSNFLCRKVE